MKKFLKVSIVFFIILSIYFVTDISLAAGWDIWESGKDFLDKGSTESFFDSISNWVNTTSSLVVFSQMIDFIWGLGLMVVLISTVVLGIKYMMVNPNEKSRIKQATTPYIIGVVIIFGATTIWKIIIDVLEGSIL